MSTARPHWSARRVLGCLGPACPMPAAAAPARSSSVVPLSTVGTPYPRPGVRHAGRVEHELIAAIERATRSRDTRVVRWIGDDAAVVRARPFAVTSIDTIAEGVHFLRSTHAPEDVGHKALAGALSDLAAMGADGGEAYVPLALPRHFGAEPALELVRGLERLGESTGTTLAGGDVISASALVISVAVTG